MTWVSILKVVHTLWSGSSRVCTFFIMQRIIKIWFGFVLTLVTIYSWSVSKVNTLISKIPNDFMLLIWHNLMLVEWQWQKRQNGEYRIMDFFLKQMWPEYDLCYGYVHNFNVFLYFKIYIPLVGVLCMVPKLTKEVSSKQRW